MTECWISAAATALALLVGWYGHRKWRGWLPEDLSIKYGVGGMIDVVAWWLENGGDMPSEEIADILHRLVVEPILSQKR